jgi:hypothetical protein
MKDKKMKEGLTAAQEKKLLKSINQFVTWLIGKEIIESIPANIHLYELPFANEDWVMKYDPVTGDLSFNTFLSKKCSYEYFTSIILHEFFHLAVQKVPNKDDATKIKDDFGGELMKLIDIEADFYTALFYKEVWDYNLVKYLKLYYEGTKVFSDKWIRVTKLERYIGTLLSISKMFIKYHKSKKAVTIFDLYLVSIGPFSTEDNLHVLVIRKEHIYFDFIQASLADFTKIRNCYTNEDEISLKSYIGKIVSFVSKALQMDIPEDVKKEIDQIKN